MNGELYQASRLTAAARAALMGTPFEYQPLPYEKTLRFSFLDGAACDSAQAWYQGLRERGVADIKLLAPVMVKDRNLMAFSNGTDCWIICFYRDGAVTDWRAHWTFDPAQKGWQIEYREGRYENAPPGKPRFADPTADFCAVLAEIQALAERIDEPSFAACFAEARRLLTGTEVTAPLQIGLPDRNAKLFSAAGRAWVFGAMGSWNDCPPYEAHLKGLDDVYERLSGELLRQILLAVLFAVNEWQTE